MAAPYPPLNVAVRTPRLALVRATDDLLERLLPAVRDGIVGAEDLPFDDPMSLYKDSPEREWSWLRGIWAGRARADRNWWRLYFVVMVDGAPVGMQDLIGADFASFKGVSTFSGYDRNLAGAVSDLRCGQRRYTSRSRDWGRTSHQRGVHRQPRLEWRLAFTRLRTQRHELGHPSR